MKTKDVSEKYVFAGGCVFYITRESTSAWMLTEVQKFNETYSAFAFSKGITYPSFKKAVS